MKRLSSGTTHTNGGALSESSWAALVGLAVYIALRLVDYILPPGRHWPFMDRFSRPDKPPPAKPEDEKG